MAAALADAKAEVVVSNKRQDLLAKMYARKEVAVARFMDDWEKKERARIEKTLKSLRSKRR
jgi:hypothetical protein